MQFNINDKFFHIPRTAEGIALEEDATGLTFRKELIYENVPGENFIKKTPKGEQEFTVDTEKLEHWANSGNEMIASGIRVPLPIKHTDNPEAGRGEVLEYELGVNDEGRNALYGILKFRDAEAAKLAKSTDVSIFVPNDTVYDCFGKPYEHVIRHVCLTDYPVIKKLGRFEAIAASFELSAPSKVIGAGVKIARKAAKFVKPHLPTFSQALGAVKAHPLLAGAGAVSTAAWLHSSFKRKPYRGIKSGDSLGSKAARVGTAAAVLGAGGVIGHHGLHSLAKLRHAPSLVGAGVGLKGLIVAKHHLHQAKHIVKGEKDHHLSFDDLALARHNLKGPGNKFISRAAHAAMEAAKVVQDKAAYHGRMSAIASARHAKRSSLVKGAAIVSKHATALGAIAAGVAIAHHLIKHFRTKHEHALSLGHPTYHGASAAAHGVLGGILGAHTAVAALNAAVHVHNHLKGIGGSRVQTGLAIASPLVHGLFAYHALKTAAKQYKKRQDELKRRAKASQALSLESSYEKRNSAGSLISHAGRFAKDPNSKASRRESRRASRKLTATSEAVSGGSHHMPTFQGALKHAKEHVHDFYTADDKELRHGSNVLHALRHGSLSALHAGVVGISAHRLAKHGLRALRGGAGGRAKAFGHLAAVAGAAIAAHEGAFAHAEAAARHLAYHRRKK